jgi:hypothetical protein
VSLVPLCNEIQASACLAPRVWVWGFWFGFALRCVALLCGVFVRLHLALFPAGGPFLPSLSVNRYKHRALHAGGPGLSRARLISGELWELSFALLPGQRVPELTLASDRAPLFGLSCPSVEVV